MLTIDSELSAWRVRHFLESAPLDVRCRLSFQDGTNKKDYGTVAEWIDKNPLVQFGAGTLMYRYRQDILSPVTASRFGYGTGWLCCGAGHFKIWSNQASFWPGWTIILEDDAVMREGWSLADVVVMIQRNATATESESQSSSPPGLVWLEHRPCYDHCGTGAYAIQAQTAQYLAQQYHFQAPVDLWMLVNDTCPDIYARTHPRVCLPRKGYPFYTWGENRSVPSEITSSSVTYIDAP
jgi:hypothetical protein